MADFCWQCTEDILGLDGRSNDLKGLLTKESRKYGSYMVALCEGCGNIWVNNEGKCIGIGCSCGHTIVPKGCLICKEKS